MRDTGQLASLCALVLTVTGCCPAPAPAEPTAASPTTAGSECATGGEPAEAGDQAAAGGGEDESPPAEEEEDTTGLGAFGQAAGTAVRDEPANAKPPDEEADGAEPEGDGARSETAQLVARAVAENQPALRRCHHRALRDYSALQGKLIVELEIDRRGHVSRAVAISNDTGSQALAECVTKRLTRLRLGTEVDPFLVHFPFVYTPQNGDHPPEGAVMLEESRQEPPGDENGPAQ